MLTPTQSTKQVIFFFFVTNRVWWELQLWIKAHTLHRTNPHENGEQDYTYSYTHLKPLSHQTAMPQRLYSFHEPCQRAVGSPRNTPKMSHLSVIACTQRPHSVPTASTQRSHTGPTASLQRPWRFHSAQAVAAACSQRVHGVLKARTQRSHGAHTASSGRL